MEIGRDTTDETEAFWFIFLGGAHGFLDENIGDGVLDGGAHVGDDLGIGFFGGREGFPGLAHGRFETREAEIEGGVMQHGARQVEGGGISFFGEFGNDGTTWIAEAHQLGALVEGFAGGVIAGAADDFVLAPVFHQDDFGMTARDEQGENWELPVFTILWREPSRGEVTFEMIDAENGLARDETDGARGFDTHAEGGSEAGAAGDGNGVELDPLRLGRAGRGDPAPTDDVGAFEQADDFGDVGAGGDFGDDAAVAGVDGDLG